MSSQLVQERKHQRRMDAHRHLESYREGYLAATARFEQAMRSTVLKVLGEHRLQAMFEMEEDGPGASFHLRNLLALDPVDEVTQQQELEHLTDTICDALNKLLPSKDDERVLEDEPPHIQGLRRIAALQPGRDSVSHAAELAKAALAGTGLSRAGEAVDFLDSTVSMVCDVVMHLAGEGLIDWRGSGDDEDDALSNREERAMTLAAVETAMNARRGLRRAEAADFNPVMALTQCISRMRGDGLKEVACIQEVANYLKAQRDGIVGQRLFWDKVTTSRLVPRRFPETGDQLFYVADEVEFLVSDAACHACDAYDKGLRVGLSQQTIKAG